MLGLHLESNIDMFMSKRRLLSNLNHHFKCSLDLSLDCPLRIYVLFATFFLLNSIPFITQTKYLYPAQPKYFTCHI